MARPKKNPTKPVATKAAARSFKQEILASLNKSDKERQAEDVDEFLELGRIKLETKIAEIKIKEIPMKQLELKSAQNELARKEKAFEQSRLAFTKDISAYVDARESALKDVYEQKNAVTSIKKEISELESDIKYWEEMLIDFK